MCEKQIKIKTFYIHTSIHIHLTVSDNLNNFTHFSEIKKPFFFLS